MKVKKIIEFLKDEDGLELSEYAVMGALIIIAAAGIVGTLGESIVDVFEAVDGELEVPTSTSTQ
jgi:Flp pilus assembly pilin Flp